MPGWRSTPRRPSGPRSSSRACAPRPTSRSSSRWPSPTTPSAACAPSTCHAGPTGVSSAAASCARSPDTVERSPTWCPSPSPTRSQSRIPAETSRRQPMSYDDDKYDEDEYDEYDEIDDETRAGPGLRRRRRDAVAPVDRHHRDGAHDAALVVAPHRPRRDHEFLEEALQRLPDELRQARWMLKERQEFVAKKRAARPTSCSRPPASAPSGWCSGPRWSAPPSPSAPAR